MPDTAAARKRQIKGIGLLRYIKDSGPTIMACAPAAPVESGLAARCLGDQHALVTDAYVRASIHASLHARVSQRFRRRAAEPISRNGTYEYGRIRRLRHLALIL